MEFKKHDTQAPWIAGFTDEQGRVYAEAARYPGHIKLSEVFNQLLGEPIEVAGGYADGNNGRAHLGAELRIKGSSIESHALAIHPEDTQKFVQRVQAYRAAYLGYVREKDDEGFHWRPATGEERAAGREFLLQEGLHVSPSRRRVARWLGEVVGLDKISRAA